MQNRVIHPSPLYYPEDTKSQPVNGFIYCFNCCGIVSAYFILFQFLCAGVCKGTALPTTVHIFVLFFFMLFHSLVLQCTDHFQSPGTDRMV